MLALFSIFQYRIFMQKYQKNYELMIDQNKELFTQFQQIHDEYVLNPEANKSRFNEIGSQVQDVIRHYENILCGKTENGGKGKFSSNLSQKFWDLVRKDFPKIDFVGVK